MSRQSGYGWYGRVEDHRYCTGTKQSVFLVFLAREEETWYSVVLDAVGSAGAVYSAEVDLERRPQIKLEVLAAEGRTCSQ